MRLDPDIAGELVDAAVSVATDPSRLARERLHLAVIAARANDLKNRDQFVKRGGQMVPPLQWAKGGYGT